MMDMMTQLYISLGVLSMMCLGTVLFIIAGKDILFAFYRRFKPRGCEVFILNSNLQFTRHYKVPKDGTFKIDGKLYITNPEKVLHLGDKMTQDVIKKIKLGRTRLMKRIEDVKNKIKDNEKKVSALGKNPQGQALIQKQQFLIFIEQLKQKQKILESKFDKKERAYYMARRGAYIYIESDPVPKDLYEFFTEMDSVQLENVIVRAQTKDPKDFKDVGKYINQMRLLIYILIIGVGIAIFIGFKNSSMLESMGGVFTI